MKQSLVVAILCLCLAGCTAAPAAPAVSAQVTAGASQCTQAGELAQLEIESATRGYNYRITVYLPPCYAAESRSYPVIYLIPGRGGGPGAWFAAGANAVADRLILAGSLPPLLMVGTENTDGDPQGEAILKDVIPYIEAHYRVRAERSQRGVAGGSLGGVASYRLAFMHPEAFSSAGIFGSGVNMGEERLLEDWIAALGAERRVRVFLACGDKDILMLERARITASLLEAGGMEYVLQELQGGHDYATWTSSLEQYLLWLAKEW